MTTTQIQIGVNAVRLDRIIYVLGIEEMYSLEQFNLLIGLIYYPNKCQNSSNSSSTCVDNGNIFHLAFVSSVYDNSHISPRIHLKF